MEEQGIMSLGGMGAPAPAPVNQPSPFDPAASAAFEAARQQIDPREFGSELLTAAEETDPAAVQEFKNALQSMQLPPEVIDALGQMVDAILAEPQNYQEIRAEFIQEGVPEELLPPEFDAAYFGALNMALDQMSGSTQPMPVQGFANGGIVTLNPIAQILADQGRNGDRMLAHITPAEARMLRRRGGSGTINPVTGLPEFFFKSVAKAVGGVFKGAAKAVGSVVKGVAGAVKKFASSTVGKVVTAVALGFFLGPAAASALGVTSAAGVAAVSGFVGGFGSSLLAGQSLSAALKSGAFSGVFAGATAGVTGGMGAFESGSYAGPTTISGQWNRAVESGKSLLGMPSAQPEVTGTLQYTGDGQVLPGSAAPSVPSIEEQTAAMFDQRLASGAPFPGEGAIVPSAATVSPLETQSAAMFDQRLASGAPFPGEAAAGVPPIEAQSARLFDQRLASGAPFPGEAAAGVPPIEAQSAAMFDQRLATGNAFPGEELGGGLRLPGTQTSPSLMAPRGEGITSLTSPSATGTAGFQQAPSAMDLFKQGEYVQGAKELFSPTSYTDQQLINSPVFQSARGAGASYSEAMKAASNAYNPSFIRSYGPTVAAGTAVLGGIGGFGPQEQPAPGIVPQETGFDLLARSPEIYGTTPGGANIQYGTPQYMGYGLPTRQFSPMQYALTPVRYPSFQYSQQRPMFAAEGGIASLKKGGTPKFPRKNGAINGPGTGTSDDIPAMLSDGEFVFTAKAVRGLGNGSRREGARRMYAMMKALEGKA